MSEDAIQLDHVSCPVLEIMQRIRENLIIAAIEEVHITIGRDIKVILGCFPGRYPRAKQSQVLGVCKDMQAVVRLVDAVKDFRVVARPIDEHEDRISTVQESFNVGHALTGIHVNIYNEEKNRNATV